MSNVPLVFTPASCIEDLPLIKNLMTDFHMAVYRGVRTPQTLRLKIAWVNGAYAYEQHKYVLICSTGTNL